MGYLRVYLYRHQFISLTYGLPLLICLWHRDRRLLWSMAGAFAVMATFKAFWLMPTPAPEDLEDLAQWIMQVLNIGIVACTVHLVLNLMTRLATKNVKLQAANEELAAREEEIAQQNEELQVQAEELSQQNEELQQQSEEMQQQAEELERQTEELQSQGEELQSLNEELRERESTLQIILTSLVDAGNEQELLQTVCRALVRLAGPSAVSAAVLEREGDELKVRALAGPEKLRRLSWPLGSSFAALVMKHERTAFVDDITHRPDLIIPEPETAKFRSLLATPLRIEGKPVGVLEVYSVAARQWTTQEFQIIEWVAAQCSLALGLVRLHQALRRAQGELVEVNARLEQQVQERTARLQESMGELEHFSYTITHDMRAPLRAMQGFAGILAELCANSMQPEKKKCIDQIMTSAARMDRLITDALSYSRTVKQELLLSGVDPMPLLHGMLSSYPAFQPPNAKVEIEGELPRVLANEAGLTQCFSNLLNNAIKFVAPGTVPMVKIRAETADGMARFWFEDNGIGIPKSAHVRIFDMFHRVSKTYDGTGVGLALVKKVIERMGGRVGVESEPGQGSRFWLELRLEAAVEHSRVRTVAGQTRTKPEGVRV